MADRNQGAGAVIISKIKKIYRDDQGATAVEYGLILALVFLAMAGAVGTLGASSGGMWDDIATKVDDVMS